MALQDNHTLRKLYLSNNNITSEAGYEIASVISNNMYLKDFSIGGNHLHSVGIINIAKRLQNIATLTKLCINANKITQNAAEDIAIAKPC